MWDFFEAEEEEGTSLSTKCRKIAADKCVQRQPLVRLYCPTSPADTEEKDSQNMHSHRLSTTIIMLSKNRRYKIKMEKNYVNDGGTPIDVGRWLVAAQFGRRGVGGCGGDVLLRKGEKECGDWG